MKTLHIRTACEEYETGCYNLQISTTQHNSSKLTTEKKHREEHTDDKRCAEKQRIKLIIINYKTSQQ